MAADTTSLHLRLPKSLYKNLQRQARRNNVSLNTEIVNQLAGHDAATETRLTQMVRPLIDQAVSATPIGDERALREAWAILPFLERRLSGLQRRLSELGAKYRPTDEEEVLALTRERDMVERKLQVVREALAKQPQHPSAGILGEPVRRWEVIPLNNPIPATPDSPPVKANQPAKAKEPVSEPEKK
jgi:hypothetical protein